MEEQKTNLEPAKSTGRMYDVDLNRVEKLSEVLSNACENYTQEEIALAFSYAIANAAIAVFLKNAMEG